MAPELLHDQELLRRIAAKDEDALKELYGIYGQRLFAYALRVTNDEARAEDAVQEALIVIWQKAGGFRSEGRPIAWILGIVHNTALKSLRHRTERISNVMENSLVAADLSPEEHLQVNQQANLLHQGLKGLSPEHREALELIFYQGLSLEEAARVCLCPVGTIKSRLSYARQRLKGLMNRAEAGK